MNYDHFGIVITFIILAGLLAVAVLSQSGIGINFGIELPTQPQNSGFENYCEQLNLKC